MRRGEALLRSNDELADLLVAAGRGDRDAFRALYHATSPKLFGIILRIIRNRAAAEDVLQDVYLKNLAQCGELFARGGSRL